MRCVDAGHTYILDSMEGTVSQTIQFIDKKQVDGQFKTIKVGTTNEDVLRMLIDRMKWLNNLCGCRENSICITKLEESLMWLEKRTADRVARNVEGKPDK